MATGDKSFSTGSVTKTKRNFDPVRAGDYDLKLLKVVEIKTAEPRKNEKTGEMSKPVPRVGVRFEVLESAEDGGRNKMIFHDLTTNMTPDKGGVVGPTGADQLKGLADAFGEEAEVGFIMYKPKGSDVSIKIIDPRQLKAWCEAHADQVVRAHIKVQAGTKDYPEPKNKLTEFFEPSGSEGANDGDNEGIPDEDDAALDELPDLDEKPAKKVAPPAKKKR